MMDSSRSGLLRRCRLQFTSETTIAQPIVPDRCQCNLIAGTGAHADSSLIHWSGPCCCIVNYLRWRHIACGTRGEHQDSVVRFCNKEPAIGGNADFIGTDNAWPGDRCLLSGDDPQRFYVRMYSSRKYADLRPSLIGSGVVDE